MTFTVPIYIEEAQHQGDTGQMFTVRPLFHSEPVVTNTKLARSLEKLRTVMLSHLLTIAKKPRHDDLAAWSHSGELKETTLKLRFELKSKSYAFNVFLVGVQALDRELWHTPRLPALWFEVLPGQTLQARAAEVLTHHLREHERETEEFDIEHLMMPQRTKARLTFIDMTMAPGYRLEKESTGNRMAIFGGEEKLNGEQELRRVGRRLDTLYPDDLQRSIMRDEQVQELAAKLLSRTRRAVLITGPRMVGKSALIHEAVHYLMRTQLQRRGRPREVWLVSPMRLISGMSYVGQWENRVLAILKHAEKKQIVLCFDDLLGLLEAGKSASNDLNVAQVLKPWIEQRRVRLLAESTPEVLRVLRERDRALAEAFELLPLEEPDEDSTTRILIHVQRNLERQHGCSFNMEVLPAIMDLQRRFVRDAVFPGKGAAFLHRMAIKHARSIVSREDVLHEFRERSGLAVALIDENESLSRAEMVDLLSYELRGQDHVLHAFADVLVRLKARLHDPARPLAAMLLLGPTGVGKTEAAKALTRHLFGDESRLLRFDMNEMTDGSAVVRLIGSPREPDGLLTNAIRRQPFAVVLFDEIEKGAPEVFDLLLAVLDEGRLTDALGRVADFTNAVVLLTSNLGSRAAQSRVGFQQSGSAADDSTFISAAEKFFRPEFFNRLDAVLPFRDLSEYDLRRIAENMINKLLARDGLRQRSCFVTVTEAAKDRLASLGHHPQLGARALKRVLEREVAEPLALELAAMPAVQPLRILMDAQPAGAGFITSAQPVRLVPHSVTWPERLAKDEALARTVLPLCLEALERIATLIDDHSPTGPVELTALTREQKLYYQWREQLQRVQEIAEAAERSLQPKPKKSTRTAQPLHVPQAVTRKVVKSTLRGVSVQRDREVEAAHLRYEMSETLAASTDDIADTAVVELVRELALLELIVTTPHDSQPARLQVVGGSRVRWATHLVHAASMALHKIFGEDSVALSSDGQSLVLHDPAARQVVASLAGVYWCDDSTGADSLCQATLLIGDERRVIPSTGPVDVTFRLHASIGDYARDILLVDLRTGLEFNSELGAAALRPLLLSTLPVPEELRDTLADNANAETLNPQRPKAVRRKRIQWDEDEIPF